LSGYGYDEQPDDRTWFEETPGRRDSGFALSPWCEQRGGYGQAAQPTGRVAVVEPGGYAVDVEPGFDRGYDPRFDRRPDADWAAYDPDADEFDRPTKARKITRVVVIVSAVAALLLVGVVAFGATIMLGGGPAGKKTAHAGLPTDNGPADATGPDAQPLPSENAVADPAPSAVAPTPPSTTPPAAKARKPPVNPPNAANLPAETAVLVIVNAERAKAGCKALTVNSKLAAAARKHSADMLARHYFSHTTPDGVTFSVRIDAEGYRWSGVGENIAAGQRTPTDVMRAWMNSPGHRANILNCQFRNLGVGMVQNGRSPVWTQDFGTPR
jgi:uncharacterized protein YkwD